LNLPRAQQRRDLAATRPQIYLLCCNEGPLPPILPTEFIAFFNPNGAIPSETETGDYLGAIERKDRARFKILGNSRKQSKIVKEMAAFGLGALGTVKLTGVRTLHSALLGKELPGAQRWGTEQAPFRSMCSMDIKAAKRRGQIF
jgi:hypothetical protein